MRGERDGEDESSDDTAEKGTGPSAPGRHEDSSRLRQQGGGGHENKAPAEDGRGQRDTEAGREVRRPTERPIDGCHQRPGEQESAGRAPELAQEGRGEEAVVPES